jgi:hypothetical protein
MIYNINAELRAELYKLPETGMGYQIAEVKYLNQYGPHRMLILNAEIGVLIDNLTEYENKYRSLKFQALKNQANTRPMKLLRFIERKQWHLILEEESNWPKKPARDSIIEQSNGIERFVRLSAYENDFRVDKINNCFIPGTYATTEDDYVLCVKTNDNPIERYALPNDEPIKHAFYNIPIKGDQLQRGTVEPDFGKRGGGKEIIFPNGTSKNSYLGTVDYGKFLDL